MKILVTYFTASFGNTKKIAQKIAEWAKEIIK